jgi:(p)ppGpp synthase/HD superfamily hydrolase
MADKKRRILRDELLFLLPLQPIIQYTKNMLPGTLFPILSSRFEDALIYASHLHARQLRKGTQIPYLAHLLGVTSLVLEDGGSEDEAIGALLHDAVEDQGGLDTLEEIRRRFGQNVALIVEGCTDSFSLPKPSWRERKEAYIDHLWSAPSEVRRVSLADKLHNARSLIFTYRQMGEKTWARFNGGKEGSLWYYRSLLHVFQETGNSPMVEELAKVVADIHRMVDESEATGQS